MSHGRILIVEDDRFYRELCREALEEEGYDVDATLTGEEALAKLENQSYQIMVLDMVLPGIDGHEVLSRAKQSRSDVDVIFMTGYASVESAVRALKSGASDYLTKPLNPEELKLSVKRCIEFRGIFEENNELKELVKLYQTVQLVSNTLEAEKLYDLSLDAILHGLDAQTGVAFFFDNDSSALLMKSFRGLDKVGARIFADVLLKNHLEPLPDKIRIVDDFNALEEIKRGIGEHLMLIPLKEKGDKKESVPYGGLIAAVRDRPYGRKETENAGFISEQVSLSIENAVNYEGARKMIFVDDVTGLYNMRYLDVSLENEIKRAKRFRSDLSVLFMDLDYFKEINDNYGHLVGSRMLEEAGKLLKNCVREVDIPIRYGGDEFVVILVETDRRGAMKVAERIRGKIEEHKFMAEEGINTGMTCCLGVASYPEDAKTKLDLIHLADKAMYRGKETTRNCVYSAAAL